LVDELVEEFAIENAPELKDRTPYVFDETEKGPVGFMCLL